MKELQIDPCPRFLRRTFRELQKETFRLFHCEGSEGMAHSSISISIAAVRTRTSTFVTRRRI